MPLFQKNITKQYIASFDKDLVKSKWLAFKNYFHNPITQKNIRAIKEEAFQEGFIRELFVNILGYKLNPTPDYNLVLEKKNVEDARKADAAIIIEGQIKAVIELKDTRTTELSKVKDQAFGYKVNQPDSCTYVITANFEKIRLYIDNAVDFEEFNLFTLNEDEFPNLLLCLDIENLSRDIPKKIKSESLSREEIITKSLYRDYSLFKRELHQNLVQLNPSKDPLILLRKSQKLIDRFLFLLFGEDRQLLPINSVRIIIKGWENLKDLDEYLPLYDRFKKYFGYMNTGYQSASLTVFAYNGGLFKPDEILDTVIIDDDLLYKHTLKLSEYDFENEADVYILGHIFENTINDVEVLTAELSGRELDKSNTKRKKDGVFYTPKYITKYIVDSTIGKLCHEKKNELGIGNTAVSKHFILNGKKNELSKIGKDYNSRLLEYRKWLLDLKICDPACGSGAFLNQALEFLITEHNLLETYVLELQNMLAGDGGQFATGMRDVTDEILENNIYGVDINEESIEIAKLSLWLRTARPGRKLSDLSKNIKCGNSLIDDPNVAGDKAFNWEKEFPQVFENGGFDVVLGNPPYVQIKESNVFFNSNYSTVFSGDLYALFFEKGLSLVRENGVLGFITPSSYMTNLGFISLREFLLNFKITELIDLGANVFKDAQVDSAIIIVESYNVIENYIKVGSNLDNLNEIDQNIFKKLDGKNFNIYINPEALELCNRVESSCFKFENYLSFSRGVEFGFKSEFVFTEKKNEHFVPLLCGGNISKQHITFENKFIEFDDNKQNIYKSRDIYDKEKILVKRIGNNIIGSFDDTGFYNVCDVYNIQLRSNDNYSLKSISSIINSRFINFYHDTKFKSVKLLFPKIPIQNLKLLPIPMFIKNSDLKLVMLTDEVLEMKKLFHQFKDNFSNYLMNSCKLSNVSSRLLNWVDLNYSDFILELNKMIKTNKVDQLSKKDEFEWMELFEEKKKRALELKSRIDQTDKEIDRMVYELYGLTQEEIQIVENN